MKSGIRSGVRQFWARVRGLFGGDGRIREEIETHIAMLSEQYEQTGMPPQDARAAARREFGSATQILESHREQRSLPIDSVRQDLRFAFRQLRAHPGFAATAILTLALGIGANAAIFNLLDTVVLQPLPVPDPEQLVILQPFQDGRLNSLSYPQMREMAARQKVADAVFASEPFAVRESAIDGRAPRVQLVGNLVTENYFEGLRVSPLIGRLLQQADQVPGAEPVVAISYGLWRREFAFNSDTIGKTLRVNGLTTTIVGVTPPGFFGETLGKSPDFWLPLHHSRHVFFDMTQPGITFLQPLARLRAGIPLSQAEAELDGLYYQVRELGTSVKGTRLFDIKLSPGSQGLGGLRDEFSRPLWLLMGIVGVIALIASCNLATLLLARGTARRHEISVRRALGAGQRRLIRQLLTESALLAAVGGAAGFLVAWWGARMLTALAVADETARLSADPGWRAAAFTVLVAVVATFAFGLAPALSAARGPLTRPLQSGRRTHTPAPIKRASAFFVVAQVALSMLLVAAAALLGRSFWQITHQDFGYQTDGVLVAPMSFDGPSLKAINTPGFFARFLEATQALPGVRASALQMGGPLGSVSQNGVIALPEREAAANDKATVILVSARYFETMGIPIVRGRPINTGDAKSTPAVAVINESAARRFFGQTDPVGRVFTASTQPNPGSIRFDPSKAIQIVGIARDVRFRTPRDPFEPIVFLAIAQGLMFTSPELVVHSTGNPLALVESLKKALDGEAPGATFSTVRPLNDTVLQHVRRDRLLAWLSGAFGVVALVLAAVGLYGVVAYAAELRIQEMGIRLALGALPAQVRGLLLGEVARLLGAGLAIGLVMALVLTRALESLLFELAPHDPVTLAAAAALLAVVAVAAGYLPARRVAKLDPTTALRQE